MTTRGFVPLRVAATQGAAGLPFGAFASLVPDLTLSADLLEMLRRIADAVVGRSRGRPVAVLVDDAHLLDQSSAALMHLLATTPQTFVLATLRSGEQALDAVVVLWKDGLAERIELHPLAANDIEELLSAALRGPVDGATVHLLHRRTQGNVLFLRELVLGALEAGVLRCEEGIWRLGGTLPASSRLMEIIQTRLGGLDEPDRRALDVLALGEPLEVDLLQVVETQSNLEALEGRRLVRIEQDGRRLIARLAHPLYSEVLRERLSPLRSHGCACPAAQWKTSFMPPIRSSAWRDEPSSRGLSKPPDRSSCGRCPNPNGVVTTLPLTVANRALSFQNDKTSGRTGKVTICYTHMMIRSGPCTTPSPRVM